MNSSGIAVVLAVAAGAVLLGLAPSAYGQDSVSSPVPEKPRLRQEQPRIGVWDAPKEGGARVPIVMPPRRPTIPKKEAPAPGASGAGIRDTMMAPPPSRSRAESFFDEGLKLLDEGGAWDSSGRVNASQRKTLLDAVEQFRQASSVFRAERNARREIEAIRHIGTVYHTIGDQVRAMDYYSQSMLRAYVAKDRVSEAASLFNIGVVYYTIEDTATAVDYLTRSLAAARAAGAHDNEIRILKTLATMYTELKNPRKAEECRQQAVDVAALAEAERAAWQKIRDSTDAGDFRAFLKMFPNSAFADKAKARIEQLGGK